MSPAPSPLAPAAARPVAAEIWARALAAGRPREVELFLLTARTAPSDEAIERIRTLARGGVDWAYVVGLVDGHGVWPVAHRTLSAVAGIRLPGEVAAELRTGAHATAALVQIRIEEVAALDRALAEQGVEALFFKGVALGGFAYGNPARRRPGDIDVLVRHEDFGRAREVLVERGYRSRVPADAEGRYLRTHSGIAFEHPEGNVDLHATLEQRAFDSLPFSVKLGEEVWARSVTVDLGGAAVRTLSGEDALIHLCAHGARHSWVAFYAVCDVAEVIGASPALDWDCITERVQERGSSRIFHLGLLLACGLLDADVPPEVYDRAARDEPAAALAAEVSEWLFDPESTAGAIRHEDLAGSLRHHQYHMKLLERPADKVTYVVLRGLRMLKKKLPTSSAARERAAG